MNKKRGINPIVVILLSLIIAGAGAGFTGYQYYKQKYAGDAVAYSRQLIKDLPEEGFERTMAGLFYSDEEIETIKKGVDRNAVSQTEALEENPEGIEIIPLKGPTYQAFMMIVHHPEDVIVAVNPTLDSAASGLYLDEYLEAYGAIAGINAGGFEDAGGNGNGGQAWGIVIHDGKLISGRMSDYTSVIGINYANRLVVGDMSAEQALQWDIRDAVTFGPIFIKEYQVVFKSGQHPGLNPRTVIGQRDDGAFLFLVIDGRQPISFGSTYQDIIDIMQQFGAVNAANLDGGNSTIMMYRDQVVNSTVSIYGGRHLPTAFIVKEHE